MRFEQIEIEKARMSEQNVRQTEEGVDSLVASIKAVDVIEPVVAIEKDGVFEVVVGQRRTVAAKKAGKSHIPALIYDETESAPARLRAISLIENEERTDLTNADKEEAVSELVKELGSPRKAAEAIGWTEGKVRKWMRYEGLPEEVKEMTETGLTTEDAFRLADLMDRRPTEDIKEIAVELTKVVDRPQRTRILAHAKHPGVSVETLKKKAEVAKRQRKITLIMDTTMVDALSRAADDLRVEEVSDAAEKILDLWLEENKYYPEPTQ